MLKFIRTPQLIILGTAPGAMFLLIVPGFVATDHQPVTYMVDAIPVLAEGPVAQRALGHDSGHSSYGD